MNDLERIMKLPGVHKVKDQDTQGHPVELRRFNNAILDIMKDELENLAGREKQLTKLGDLQNYNAVLYHGDKGHYGKIERFVNTLGVAARNKVWKAIFDSGLKDPHNMHI